MTTTVPHAWQFELQRADLAKGFHAGQNEIPGPFKFQHPQPTVIMIKCVKCWKPA